MTGHCAYLKGDGLEVLKSWMGPESATRFHAEQRETKPADGAAPAAKHFTAQVAGFQDPDQVDATRSANAGEVRNGEIGTGDSFMLAYC
jgi:hypothetical protein